MSVLDLLIMEQTAFSVISNRKLKNKKRDVKHDDSSIQSTLLYFYFKSLCLIRGFEVISNTACLESLMGVVWIALTVSLQVQRTRVCQRRHTE